MSQVWHFSIVSASAMPVRTPLGLSHRVTRFRVLDPDPSCQENGPRIARFS
jgi:hypothetical protein